ncbi:Cytochrome c oxidase subunit 4 [Blastocladiella emersonii ATCC 22665]|nr:Cytochrome c oxidase subunit 4 [Blastocladiella emersonii ATCC 22665]
MIAARLTRAVAPRLAAAHTFSAAAIRLGGHGPAEPFVGPGTQPGKIPTDLEQSTGLERFEYLSELEGRNAFDMKPLEPTHLGTPANPIVVESVENVRYVGCTGYPVDSHDTIWIRVNKTKEEGVNRCPECGGSYQLKMVDAPHFH